MATQPPKRRFAPVPVETSTRSSNASKSADSPASTRQLPRSFAPELVEADPRSTEDDIKHDSQQETDHDAKEAPASKKPAVRRFAVEPVESTVRRGGQNNHKSSESEEQSQPEKKPRKFAVEPVETTTKRSKPNESTNGATKAPRKFAVEPVESTTKSSRTASDKGAGPKRFTPEPVESTERTHRSSRNPKRRDSELDETPADLPSSGRSSKSTRKFAVELIDTSARSRRASDENVPTPHDNDTDVTPGHMLDSDGQSVFPASLIKRKPLLCERRRDKQHSFIAPDLETIASSEDDQSEAGTPDRSANNSFNEGSPLTTSDYLADSYKKPPMSPKTNGPSFSSFLLDAERKRAEQMLRDQALAAFPNSDFHEPVEHYMDHDDRDDSSIIDDRPTTWDGHDEDDEEPTTPVTRRKATSKIDWELIELRKHHEALEEKRAAAASAAASQTEKSDPWWHAGIARDFAAAGPDAELSQMRKGARPPMLGSDLVFPRSSSPLPARFDTTQASGALGSTMCPLTEQAHAQRGSNRTVNGLWGAPASASTSSTESKGLWGGFCAASANSSRQSSVMPSGLVTPAPYDHPNPFEQTSPSPQRITPNSLRPPTPPYTRGKPHAAKAEKGIDAVLQSERELDALMEKDYPDDFVTQVFNYLSLGYPTLARPFDEELSKITSVTMLELRQDDAIARSMPKGYIRIGEDFEGRNDGVSQELEHNKCARWRALKIYIREWAKQDQHMVHVRAPPYGTAPRKGSWAW